MFSFVYWFLGKRYTHVVLNHQIQKQSGWCVPVFTLTHVRDSCQILKFWSSRQSIFQHVTIYFWQELAKRIRDLWYSENRAFLKSRDHLAQTIRRLEVTNLPPKSHPQTPRPRVPWERRKLSKWNKWRIIWHTRTRTAYTADYGLSTTGKSYWQCTQNYGICFICIPFTVPEIHKRVWIKLLKGGQKLFTVYMVYQV